MLKLPAPVRARCLPPGRPAVADFARVVAAPGVRWVTPGDAPPVGCPPVVGRPPRLDTAPVADAVGSGGAGTGVGTGTEPGAESGAAACGECVGWEPGRRSPAPAPSNAIQNAAGCESRNTWT